MRLRPRSIRVRDTLIATVISMFAIGVPAAAVDVAIRNAAQEHYLREVQIAARRVSTAVQERQPLVSPLPPDPTGVDLIQVVDENGRVVHATRDAAGRM